MPVQLTQREREVLEYVGQGLADRAIAFNLNISVHTVRSHLRSVFVKTGLRNRTAVAAWFLRGGGTVPADPEGD
jgi:DNA-binding NarL/FixJ family response regulator